MTTPPRSSTVTRPSDTSPNPAPRCPICDAPGKIDRPGGLDSPGGLLNATCTGCGWYFTVETATVVELEAAARRRCRHCELPFIPPLAAQLSERLAIHGVPGTPLVELLSAWLGGFCSRSCAHAHALDEVAQGTAWWLRSKGGAR